MDKFQNRDTINCWRNVKDCDTGAYIDPSTSMTISIIYSNGTYITTEVNMTKDSMGKYHYYFQSEGHTAGVYTVKYTAVDGVLKSTLISHFELETTV